MGTNFKVDRIIFFDGVCNLCNSSVNFVIDRDPKSLFKFATLQSSLAENLLDSTVINPADVESIVFLSGNRIFRKSRAALEISRHLRGIWPMFYILIIIPGFIRDFIYNFIAKNRYKWFGKQDTCRIPTPELKSRFLDS